MSTIPQTVICRACAAPFAWKGTGRKPHYCTDADCRRRRANDRAYRHFLTHKAKGGTPHGRTSASLTYTPPVQPAIPRATLPGEHEPYVSEPPAKVERLLAQARAARLRRERETGQRTFTITDGWLQRAGRSCMDGECRLSEVA